MFSNGFFTTIDNLLVGMNDLFGKPIDTFCKLDTLHNHDNALIADDGSIVSLLELHGSMNSLGSDEFDSMVDIIAGQMAPYLKSKGHTIQVVFDYDRNNVATEVKKALKPSRSTAANLGLDVIGLMDDWESSVSKWCGKEHIFLALWTRPFILTPTNEKNARKEMVSKMSQSVRASDCQKIDREIKELRDAHHAFTTSIKSTFSDANMIIDDVDPHDFLWELRSRIDDELTSDDWRASLPGDPLPVRMPDLMSFSNINDLKSLIYPRIGEQIMPRDAIDITQNILRIGNAWHASLIMSIPPQNPKPFNVLFKKLLQSPEVPWRMSILLEGGGLDSIVFRSMLSTLLHLTSSHNKRFNLAVDNLKAREMEGDTIVKFKCVFSTMLRDKSDETYAVEALSKRLSELVAGVQAWGNCEASTIVGDPLLGFSASLPGLMPSSPAPATPAPISDIIKMLPLTRPASVWRNGSVLLRTPDGKLMPYSHNSSNQASWIDIGVAPMGGGKSVWLNTFNFGFIFQGGITRLPWLSIIDIGPSSSGLITLIKSSLPDNKKHLAAYHRLRMTPDFAINPFDTPLGCRKPFPQHMSFLINLVSLFATEVNASSPQDGIPAIARACIEASYEELSDSKNPRIYTQHMDIEVDKAISYEPAIKNAIDHQTSWWDIVDALFSAGHVHEAVRAQRYAMPLLADVGSIAKRDIITGVYKHETDHNESITDFFWRSCIDAISAYPILKEPSRFDIGDSQIVSLDLDEVAPRGGPEADKQTGVMYMLARQVIAGRFFLMPADVQSIPKLFKAYHTVRIDNLRQDPKRLCYDEVHRISRSNSVSAQIIGDLETSARESRKWNLSIGLYSQSIHDYPAIIIELATSVFILGAGTDEMANTLVEKFGLNPSMARSIMRLGQPGPSGANLVGVFKTSKGLSSHVLTNTIGSQALWAFSSTTEDVTVRNKLYDRIGVRLALKKLGSMYPGGSIKKEVESRRMAASDKGRDSDEDMIDVLTDILHEIQDYKTFEDDMDIDY